MPGKFSSKLIKSLDRKKYREQHQLFVVEGHKMVLEALQSAYEVEQVLCTPHYLDSNPIHFPVAIELVEEKEFKNLSFLTTPQGVMALVKIPHEKEVNTLKNNYITVLNQIQDPGNFGTILRTSAWFGQTTIFCEKGTVDCYSPKVVQASMGTIFHCKIHYFEPNDLLNILQQNNYTIATTAMQGNSIFATTLPQKLAVVYGNEGNGISEFWQQHSKLPLTIPGAGFVESLNVAISHAMISAKVFETTSV